MKPPCTAGANLLKFLSMLREFESREVLLAIKGRLTIAADSNSKLLTRDRVELKCLTGLKQFKLKKQFLSIWLQFQSILRSLLKLPLL